MSNIEDYADLEFFQSIPKSLTNKINELGTIQNYYPGKIILNQGSQTEIVFMLLRGVVHVFTTSTIGRDYVLAKLVAGDWLDVISCINNIPNNPASVIAVEPVTILKFSSQNFKKLYDDEPLFALRVTQNISNRATHLAQKLEDLALHSVSGRLATFILEHANEQGVIYWRCTHNDIAIRIGTVSEVVGRTLRQFADEGLIILPKKNCIVIKDEDGLQKKTYY